MRTAITRAVSPSMNGCQLTYLDRVEIDVPRAAAQHDDYVRCLRAMGLQVVTLAADPGLPDSVFVEDPVVAVDEVAVMTRMGAESRRGESGALAAALADYRPLRWMMPPATLEGGDVTRVGRTLYAGISGRTNAAGIWQLREMLAGFEYEVRAVEVQGCLHLKSGACSLGRDTVLVNREWVDATAFGGVRILDVQEPWAADVLAIDDTVLMPAGYPRTAELLDHEGFRVRTIDVSELQKAEAGVTCMSVVLEGGVRGR